LNTPPVAVPAYITASLCGSFVSARTRPPRLLGPVEYQCGVPAAIARAPIGNWLASSGPAYANGLMRMSAREIGWRCRASR
jgi:hypothetical protein